MTHSTIACVDDSFQTFVSGPWINKQCDYHQRKRQPAMAQPFPVVGLVQLILESATHCWLLLQHASPFLIVDNRKVICGWSLSNNRLDQHHHTNAKA